MTIVAKTPAYPRPVWDLVRELVDNELSIIPLRGKSPFRQWKGAQWYRADHSTVTRWIDQGFGLGVVHGKVSGGLVSRDWDEPCSYQKWAADYPNLAATLPTVETSRGFHTYARTSEGNLTDIRKALHKPYSTGAIVLGDGELRCGTGCYNVIPPSVHPSGVRYRWAVPIPSSGFPEVDLFDTGFFDLPALGVTGVTHDVLAPVLAPLASGESLSERIEEAIRRTQPSAFGQRNRRLFDLARLLRGIPALALAGASDLNYVVDRWHSIALPYIRTKPFKVSMDSFTHAWNSVRFPPGCSMALVLARARASPVIGMLGPFGVGVLAAVCRGLQHDSGPEPFYLACRKAGDLLEVSHMTANRWLRQLTSAGVIEVIVKGTKNTMQATTFRYVE
jgi:hypothetical protein